MEQLSLFTKHVAQDARYFPTLIGAFVVGLLLLLFKELSDPIKQHLVPSLIIYVIGTAFIAYLQSMLALRKQLEDEKAGQVFTGNSKPVFGIMVGLHVLWLAGLIWYNFHKGCL
jgi:hypothetical protein